MVYKLLDKIKSCFSAGKTDYEIWIKQHEKEEKETELPYRPLISVVVPVYNVARNQLTECIESVLAQTYPNYELCLADDASTMPEVREVLQGYENHPRVRISYRTENGHISRCTNTAISLAKGEFIAFMDCDDVLSKNALYEVVSKLNEQEYDFVYSDEDKIDEDGQNRHMPHFKSDWAPDTLMANMYTCHFGVYRKTIVDELGGLRPGYEGAQDYDFTLRFTEKSSRIGHIPKILYHWRERQESTAIHPEAKPYILEAARKSKQDALERRGLEGTLELIEGIYQYRVKYNVQGSPLVSVIIPSKDNFDVYRRCVESLLEKTSYRNIEIITVDNGSREENRADYEAFAKQNNIRYFYKPMEFNFSAMCNLGVKQAEGEYVLLLNDDIEVIEAEWLERMLGQAQLEDTGAVGAKLYYPGSKLIQHDGVILNHQGPVHLFAGMDDDNIYYFGRNRLDYNYSAVTAACLLVKKEKYRKVGGFDESFAVAYNDVDFCLRLVEAGWYNVVRNDAVLYHHESISRGNDAADTAKLERLKRERIRLYQRHKEYIDRDPFYSPNLTQDKVDCSIHTGFSNTGMARQRVKTVSRSQPERQQSMAFSIDKILVNMKAIRIDGWCVLRDSRWNNLLRTGVILAGEKQSYYINTQKRYREGMEQLADCRRKCNLSSFIMLAETRGLEPGNYRILLKKGGRITATGETVQIDGVPDIAEQ